MATFADQHWVGAAMLQPRFTYAQRISMHAARRVRSRIAVRRPANENERCPSHALDVLL
jgi:hypothetical protein